MINLYEEVIYLSGFIPFVIFAIFFLGRIFFWYKFYDYQINGVFLVASFFHKIPIYSLNIDDIAYIEKGLDNYRAY